MGTRLDLLLLSAGGSALGLQLPNSLGCQRVPCSCLQLGSASPQSTWSTQLCLAELGWGERVYESPRFPLCPRCWLWALSRAAAELQATAQVAVTLSSLCLGLSQLLPGSARLGDRRDESQGEDARRYRVLLWPQVFRELMPPALGPFAWRAASPHWPSFVPWRLPHHCRPLDWVPRCSPVGR